MKTTYLYIIAVVILVAGVAGVSVFKSSEQTVSAATYDEFASCLSEAGATFYGAFWCPHCQAQKELLKDSAAIPYVECSTEDGEAQTQICIDEGISGYPTWRFKDGSELNGTQSLETLGEKTSCTVPTE